MKNYRNFIKKLSTKIMGWGRLIAIVTLSAACQRQPASEPHPASERLFEETGQVVRGEFLLFFERYGGGESLGYPLTPEIRQEGWRVQYFEKGRLEYHPENEPAYQVTVGWLGELLQRRRPPIPLSAIPAGQVSPSRYFPETGHTLSGDFLNYYDINGGSVRFGQPISEPFLWEGRLTQDFQSARFFWKPDQSPPVVLENIGQIYRATRSIPSK